MSKTSIKTDLDYLESLCNYLVLQIVGYDIEPNLDVNAEPNLEIINKAINTIDKYCSSHTTDRDLPAKYVD